MSKKEGRAGSPEKPLSALGALGYKNYWTLSLMRYLSTASPGIRLEGNYQLPNHTSPNYISDQLILDISNATSITTEDICSILNQQGMIQNKRGGTPFSPSMKPSPGQSIRFVRGRKNGSTRKHLQRKQTDDDLSRGPFVPPKDYEIVWDPEAIKAYLDKWGEKGYLTLKPEKLKWSPFILQRSTKPITNAPLITMDHGTEVKIVDVTTKKSEDEKSRSLVVKERLRTPSTSRDDESSVVSSLHTQDQMMSPASSSRLKAQVEQDHKLALKLANTTTPSTRRTRLRSRDASTPQVDHMPAPDTPVTRPRRTNGRQTSNSISGTPNGRSPSVMSTVSRLRGRETRSGSAARSAATRSRSALKTPSIAGVEDDEDEEEDYDKDAEGDEDGDGDYVDVGIDVDEDEKLAMRLAEEEAKRIPMKRLRSRSGTSSNYQSSDFVRPAHVDEELLTTLGPGIKRSDSNWSLARKKRMRIDSSPIMEDSLALSPEEVKHSPSVPTLVDPAVTIERGFVPTNGFGINGMHSDPMSIKADSPPTLKMERIPEADLDIVASLAALKNGGRFSDVPSPVKDPTTAVTIITSISTDADPANPNQILNQVPNIETIDDRGFSDNPSDSLGPRMEEEDDEYGDLDAEGELDDEEGIDIEAVL